MLNTLISEEIKKQVKVEVTMLENNQTFSDYYQEADISMRFLIRIRALLYIVMELLEFIVKVSLLIE